MTITLEGGITFFGITLSPPPIEAAWFGGGYASSAPAAPRSTVDRITFATDTATATVRGPLSADKQRLAQQVIQLMAGLPAAGCHPVPKYQR
jgi:hypothetical protein